MLAFLDESGDPGTTVHEGSSRYFVVAIVTFAEADAAAACDERIAKLRGDLSLPASYEFHFSSNARSVRRSFLEAMAQQDFGYHVIALNKDPEVLNFRERRLYLEKGSVYDRMCELVLTSAEPQLKRAKLTIDRLGERRFRVRLAAHFRHRLSESKPIRSVKMETSRTNNLLLLADHIAGIAHRHLLAAEEGEKYWRAISSKEATFEYWPR